MRKERPVGLRAILVPTVFLIVWLAVCFAAFLNSLGSDGSINLMAVAIILGIGGFGGYGLARSIIRNFRRWDRGGQ